MRPDHSPTGYQAVFTGKINGKPRRATRPVVSWDGTDPLVVGSSGKYLRSADEVEIRGMRFDGVEKVGVITGVLPGQGWKVRIYGDEGAGGPFTITKLVVGWNVFTDGSAYPVVAPGDGSDDGREVRDYGDDSYLVQPDGTECDNGQILDKFMAWCGDCESSARRFTWTEGRDVMCSECHPDHPRNADRQEELAAARAAAMEKEKEE